MFSVCKLVLLLLLVEILKLCCADSVFRSDGVYTCDPRADNSTTLAFKTNLNSLFTTLGKNGPENYGFYMAAAGIAADRIYGLVQCRGDVSPQNCSTCLQESFKWAQQKCNNSNDAAIWLDWCFLHYSDGNFLGKGNNSMKALTTTNMSRTDDPNIRIKGMNFMSLLSYDVPNQPFLFKTGSVNVGKNGTRRYGLVQCNRDLSKSLCKNCTEELLEFYFSVIGNKSSYLVYSYGCRMWYNDYKFYFNYTLPSVAPTDIPIPSDSSMQLQLSFSATITMLLLLLSLSLLFSSSAL